MKIKNIIVIITLSICSLKTHYAQTINAHKSVVEKYIYDRLGEYPTIFDPYLDETFSSVKLYNVDYILGNIRLHISSIVVNIALREVMIEDWVKQVKNILGEDYRNINIEFCYNGESIKKYIPNIFRSVLAQDRNRISAPNIVSSPLVINADKDIPTQGLSFRHIALGPSHGLYIEQEDKNRWQFQRARLFGTVEDIHTFFLDDKYLIPMLENAGAVVLSPRERDTNVNEIIIDNKQAHFKGKWRQEESGYKHIDIITDENPFKEGTYHTGVGRVKYQSAIQNEGLYAIYVSYNNSKFNSAKVVYKILSNKQEYTYIVNQTMGGGGWIYLDKVYLADTVEINISSKKHFSTDAIKIGGGYGNVSREGNISRAPRWAEAARYFMQYSGVPKEVYIQQHDDDEISDYKDDYKARGDWVNYVKEVQRIPIDLSVSLHTNAGIVDSIFGSLTINYTEKGDAKYKNGKSKLASRDFADILLSQVVGDIRALHEPQWTRRALFDRDYSEVVRPDVPSVIIELLSHQNFNDMKHALNPEFKFTVCRAIYKGVLKFLAQYYQVPYVVQPLPIKNLTVSIGRHRNIKLNWSETIDKLEPTAIADYYKLYVSEDMKTWKNIGTKKQTKIVINSTHNNIKYYKIIAYNDGGKSFDSNIVSVYLPNQQLNTLIIDALAVKPLFDTISHSKRRGFDFSETNILEDDYSIIGKQYDFNTKSKFIDNDNPGWGATNTTLLYRGVKAKIIPIYDSLLENKIDFIKIPCLITPNSFYNVDNVYVIINNKDTDTLRVRQHIPLKAKIFIVEM